MLFPMHSPTSRRLHLSPRCDDGGGGTRAAGRAEGARLRRGAHARPGGAPSDDPLRLERTATSWRVEPGPPIPRSCSEAVTGGPAGRRRSRDAIAEVLVTHYPRRRRGSAASRCRPSASSSASRLLGACRFRFQQGRGAARRTRGLTLAPRSRYVLDGTARWQWQHEIPPGREERYSLTFRTLRGGGSRRDLGTRTRREVRTLTVRGSRRGPREGSWRQVENPDVREGAVAAGARARRPSRRRRRRAHRSGRAVSQVEDALEQPLEGLPSAFRSPRWPRACRRRSRRGHWRRPAGHLL